jgi:proline iminopeptidase
MDQRKLLFWIPLLFIFTMSLSAFYRPGNLREGKGLRTPLEPPAQAGVRPQYWKVAEDTEIYHFSRGKGKPALVIHGGPGYPPAQPWYGLEELTDRITFHYYHQRGCGLSTKPVEKFTSDNYFQNMVELDKMLGVTAQLADIERIRRILKADKLILIGHSYGGFLALLYALEFPEHIEKMVLIAPAGVLKMPVEEGGFEALKELLPEEKRKDYEDFLARYFDFKTIFEENEKSLAARNLEFAEHFAALYQANNLPLPESAETPEEWTGGWMVYAMYFSMGIKYDYREELKKIPVPVLVLHGERDLFDKKTSREYAGLLPKGEFRIIPRATHFPFEETPDRFAEELKSFLSK